MTQKFREEYSRTKVKKLSQLLAGLREQTWKQKQHTHTQTKKTWKEHIQTSLTIQNIPCGWLEETNYKWSSLWVRYFFLSLLDHDPDFSPQVPIFCWSDPDCSFQLSGRSEIQSLKISLFPPLAIWWDRVNKSNELTVKFNWNSIDSMSQRRNKRPPSAVSTSLPPYLVCSYLCGWLLLLCCTHVKAWLVTWHLVCSSVGSWNW